MVFGDFNEILFSWEMKGGRLRDSSQMRRFANALVDCALSDVGFKGPPFTFTNRRQGDKETKVRLDRVVANKGWLRLFPKATVTNGTALCSDHRPIVVCLEAARVEQRGQKSFRFEPMWLRDSAFGDKLSEFWRRASGNNGRLREKLRLCGEQLMRWNSVKFGNVQVEVAIFSNLYGEGLQSFTGVVQPGRTCA
ncbi:unnamed protein product [Rhodiola kirilowii]